MPPTPWSAHGDLIDYINFVTESTIPVNFNRPSCLYQKNVYEALLLAVDDSKKCKIVGIAR